MPTLPRATTLLCALLLAACYEAGDGRGPTSPTGPARPTLAPGLVVQSVTGSGHFTNAAGFWRRLTVTARRYADGTIDGEWQIVSGATIIHGNVTCLWIDGSEARVGGITEDVKFSPNVEPGWEFATRIVDNGQGVTDPADQTSRQFFTPTVGAADTFCTTGATPFPSLNDMVAGNFEVRR